MYFVVLHERGYSGRELHFVVILTVTKIPILFWLKIYHLQHKGNNFHEIGTIVWIFFEYLISISNVATFKFEDQCVIKVVNK